MNVFFENHIIIETDMDLSSEEKNEILDAVKIILRKKNKNRKIRTLDDFVYRDL